MITWDISIVCDGCKSTFSTGENFKAPFTDVTISAAWTKGWRFPNVENCDGNPNHYCPDCAAKLVERKELAV